MVDDGILQRLIRKALSNGGEYADIFIEQRRSSAVQLEDDKIEKVITGTVAGIGIRLIYNGRTVYAFSNDFTEDTLMDLAGTVSKAAAGSEKYGVIDMKKRLP
ncbi:MAG TPA: peptidase C69, partial [Nitrospiraceae bacterium]|nr:peptidase C69 [Nitrospiraceae bacterium]